MDENLVVTDVVGVDALDAEVVGEPLTGRRKTKPGDAPFQTPE